MISTQLNTARRRSSVHRSYFDQGDYVLKGTVDDISQSVSQPSHQHFQYESYEKYLKKNSNSITTKDQKKWDPRLFYRDIQEYLPDVNYKVTGLCLFWYVTSSISGNLSKTILKNFSHPVALTELQFMFSAILCILFVTLLNHFQLPHLRQTKTGRILHNFPDNILPNYLNGNFNESIIESFLSPCKLTMKMTFPMGLFQFVGHITTHKATSLIPVSLVHSMKALSPIMTVGYYRIFQKRQYNTTAYYTLMVLVAGVMITCWTNHGNKKLIDSKVNGSLPSLKGLIYATTSMFIFVSQNIFAKGILTVQRNTGMLPSASSTASVNSVSSIEIKRTAYSPNQLDKLTILFYCSCIGALLTLPPFITGEIVKGHSFIHDLSGKTGILLLIHNVTHFLQTLSAFQLIGMLSPVNYSVANIMKRIVIISVALIWEKQLNMRQLFGLTLTLLGLYGYDKWGLSRSEHQQL